MQMIIDPFLHYALLGGFGLSMVTGPLGSVVIWRRMAFFGDTVAHAALSGIALSMFFSIDTLYGVLGIPFLVALFVMLTQNKRWLGADTWLAIAAHGMLAIGIVAISLVGGNIDLHSYLFGDILAITTEDLRLMCILFVVILISLRIIWKPLLIMTINEDMAKIEGIKTGLINAIFMLLISGVVAASIKMVGVLLLTALMVMPAAGARNFANSPEQMAAIAILLSALSVIGGICASNYLDIPTSPAIVVSSLCLFFISLAIKKKLD